MSENDGGLENVFIWRVEGGDTVKVRAVVVGEIDGYDVYHVREFLRDKLDFRDRFVVFDGVLGPSDGYFETERDALTWQSAWYRLLEFGAKWAKGEVDAMLKERDK